MYFFSTWTFHLDLLTYWGVAGISHAFYIYDEAKQRQLASANLRTQLAQSKLQVLKMQLHPHFIFNTLHAIHALIPDEPEAAQDMIEGLGDLLRASLDKLEAQEVPLRQELAILDAYLGIKRKRFKDRLTLNQKISPLVLDNLVPTLIMQPLVENSIRHGIGIHSKPDEITISATPQDGNFINIEVRNCTGMLNEDTGTLTGKGVGLSNTKARLDALYGDLYSLDLQGCRIYRSPV